MVVYPVRTAPILLLPWGLNMEGWQSNGGQRGIARGMRDSPAWLFTFATAVYNLVLIRNPVAGGTCGARLAVRAGGQGGHQPHA